MLLRGLVGKALIFQPALYARCSIQASYLLYYSSLDLSKNSLFPQDTHTIACKILPSLVPVECSSPVCRSLVEYLGI